MKCNAVDSIGSSTKSSGFPFRTPAFCSVSRGTKTARREGISSPFSDARGCTSPQNSGAPCGPKLSSTPPAGWRATARGRRPGARSGPRAPSGASRLSRSARRRSTTRAEATRRRRTPRRAIGSSRLGQFIEEGDALAILFRLQQWKTDGRICEVLPLQPRTNEPSRRGRHGDRHAARRLRDSCRRLPELPRGVGGVDRSGAYWRQELISVAR